MSRRSQVVAGVLAGFLPTNGLRVWAHKHFLGVRLTRSRLGFGTHIIVSDARIEGSTIGRFNRFVGPMSLSIVASSIGDSNTFRCGEWTTEDKHGAGDYKRRLRVDEGCLVTSRHYFDVAGSLTIGRGTWIAGIGSQFWTHGAGSAERDIQIGENNYIGSAARFAPGSAIGDNNLVAMGSVVTKRFGARNLIGGVPALAIRESYDWKTRGSSAEHE